MRVLQCLALALWLATVALKAAAGETAGIGVNLGMEGQNLVVKAIFPNSPAAFQGGIHVGDRITAVAQDKDPAVPVQGLKIEQVVPLIRGPKGTTVRLTIVPSGEDDSRMQVVSFVRGELKVLARWGDGELLTNGMKAPDIEMIGLTSGTSERLSDYAGKIVVLDFWATWCAPCQAVVAELQKYPEKYPELKGKVVIIAASVDDDEVTVTRHLKAKGWDRTHNVWVGTEAIKAYHVSGVPTFYVIDGQGRIVAAGNVDLPELLLHLVRP
jgi:thiol-disulfide isomerase/thioredoxin